MNRYSVVVRLLWPGVGRMAIEEARGIPASLIAYRQTGMTPDYSLEGVSVRYLRAAGDRGLLSPLYRWVTAAYNPERGQDATVDLDLILKATSSIRGRALYHDQFAGITGYVRKLLTGEDFAVYLHETVLGRVVGIRSRLQGIIDQEVLRSAKVVCTNSKRNQSALAAHGIRAVVVYPGCNPSSDSPTYRERVIMASTVWDQNRKPEWYMELAKRTRAKVVLVGAWTNPSYMRWFREHSSPFVDVTGPVAEAEMRRIYQTSSVYVRFGFGERGPGQGGIQAFGFGLPVISNEALGMSELITHGVNGFVVTDLEDAAAKANEILNDEGTRHRMMSAARETALSLSWRAHNDLLKRELKKSLG